MNPSDNNFIIESLLRQYFGDDIVNVSHNIRGRLRIFFKKSAILDIRYPVKKSYCFYLNYKNEIYRIDTAPHHDHLETFPNHCHFKQETNIIPDKWTNIDFDLGDNIAGMIKWLEYIFDQ